MNKWLKRRKRACCHNFISALPDGYDTVIGEGGGSLSGGEKQRISIARAMLKDAPIIILDEATSSVDPENEDELQRAIEALTHDKTIIMIAHRLKTVRNADQILVLDNAHIVQRGTHAELIQQKGLYADFVSARQEGHRLEVGSVKEVQMKLHASGEDYLETILVLQNETRYGALRRCGPAHGGVKAQRVPCSGYLAGRRLSYDGRRSLSPSDRCGPRGGCKKIYKRHCFLLSSLSPQALSPKNCVATRQYNTTHLHFAAIHDLTSVQILPTKR